MAPLLLGDNNSCDTMKKTCYLHLLSEKKEIIFNFFCLNMFVRQQTNYIIYIFYVFLNN